MQVTVNLSKEMITNYLKKKKTVTVKMSKALVNNNITMKKCGVKLNKIMINIPIKKKFLCCTTCSIFLPGGEVAVHALDCGHLLCGDCLPGMERCRVCGDLIKEGGQIKIFLQ